MGSEAARPEILCFDAAHGLSLHLFCADGAEPGPAVVFLFGGGWLHGDVRHFYEQAAYFSARGFPCICVEYRTLARLPGETPALCLADVSRAMEFLAAGAGVWGIDPRRIILSGGSAGGHLALCYALRSPRVPPAALLLFNPVVDTTAAGFARGTPLFRGRERELSPLHLLNGPLPELFIAHGERDEAVSLQSVTRFCERCRSLGTRVELHVYPGQTHGFFNHPSFRPASDLQMYLRVLADCERFLMKRICTMDSAGVVK